VLESAAVLGIMVIGVLVMFRVIPLKSVGTWILGVILIVLCGPTLLSIAKGKAHELTTGNYSWWVYIVFFFAVVIGLRILIDFLFPWRRRK
jgi:hypothetical protein